MLRVLGHPLVWLLVGAGLIAAPLLFLQGPAPATATTEPPTPVADPFRFVEKRPPIFISYGNKVPFTITIPNTTGERLNFSALRCGCSCTGGTRSADTIGPGESFTVTIELDTFARTGPQTFTCQWGDQKERNWSAGVEIEILRPTRFVPEQFDAGTVAVEQAVSVQSQFVQYANSEKELPPLPEFRIQDKRFTVEPGPSRLSQMRPGLVSRETPVTVRWTIPAPGELESGPVQLVCDCHGGERLTIAQVPVLWRVPVAYRLEPSILMVGQKGRATERVEVHCADGKPFVIQSANVAPGGVEVRIEQADVKPGKPGILVLSPQANRTGGRGKLRITTTHPTGTSSEHGLTILGTAP
ncbi:MAG: hypothetical protein ACRCZF_19145 [Gemmataceae bacterium]